MFIHGHSFEFVAVVVIVVFIVVVVVFWQVGWQATGRQATSRVVGRMGDASIDASFDSSGRFNLLQQVLNVCMFWRSLWRQSTKNVAIAHMRVIASSDSCPLTHTNNDMLMQHMHV